MSVQTFNLPDLGEGLTEAEIVEWLVEDDATVGVDDAVVVVETAKATVEVPIPFAGTVTGRHGAPGEVIAVGAPLISVSASGATATPSDSAAGASEENSDEGSGAVLIGYGTGHGGSGRRRRARRGAAAQTDTDSGAATTVAAVAEAPTAAPQQEVEETLAPQVISPIVRRLAKEHGVDLHTVRPSTGNVIRRADVEAAIGGVATPQAAGATAAPHGPSTGDTRIPLTGVRRAIAEKLSTSRREIPDATTWVDADATGLLEARDQLRSAGVEEVGILALLARVCVAGLVKFPELNASVDRDEIVQHGAVHLGFAAQSPRGLVVPVVKDAHTMSATRLGAALADLTAKARTGDLAPADLTGGTFTLNNYGVFGVDGSTPIINHPEAAMLGVGRIIDRPWVVDGELTVRKVTQLGFTFDHRVADGGSAGGFLRFVADAVESPVRLLAEL